MGWSHLGGGGGADHFEFTPNTAHRIRPLTPEPVSAMVRQIPATMRDAKVSRPFRTSVSQIENEIGRDGFCRSDMHGAKDPLWDQLSDRDKFYQDRNTKQPDYSSPVHFRGRMQHHLAVWNYDTGKVEFLNQGNQLFGRMHDQAKLQNKRIDQLDFNVMQKKGKQTEYIVSALGDSRAHEIPENTIESPPSILNSARLKPLYGGGEKMWNFIKTGEIPEFEEDGGGGGMSDAPEKPKEKPKTQQKKTKKTEPAPKPKHSLDELEEDEEEAGPDMDIEEMRSAIRGKLEDPDMFASVKDVREWLSIHVKPTIGKGYTRVDKWPEEMVQNIYDKLSGDDIPM